jgi:hypothetical protein
MLAGLRTMAVNVRATERHAEIRCILARSNRNRLSESEDRIGTTMARGLVHRARSEGYVLPHPAQPTLRALREARALFSARRRESEGKGFLLRRMKEFT